MNEERLIELRMKALDLAMDTPVQGSLQTGRSVSEQRSDIAQVYLNFLCNAQSPRPAGSVERRMPSPIIGSLVKIFFRSPRAVPAT